MEQKKKLALSTQIFIALVLAIIAGIAMTGIRASPRATSSRSARSS